MLDSAALVMAVAARYRVGREIGRGGMATVYLADDLRHHRKVALKVLEPELALALGSERFLREIEIAAQVNHPHIVPLFDSGEADGFLCYVMPFVEGESLRQKLDRETHLPLDEALAITRHVAAALEHAHGRNVVHRDIKPENILLYAGEALLADFGIALAVSAAIGTRITGTGLVVGTPQYMSPEQALSEETDARSDLYSLACVLYEMLAGEPPYTGSTAQSIITKRLVDPVPSVRRLRSEVPADVDEALAKAMAKLPVDRFASVADFVKALSAPATGRAQAPSVAVLPFQNFSADPENEYFADGITEDVIAHLSKIRALKAISRTSVMPFKHREQSLREIGAKLGATTLLEGSVRRAGNRVAGARAGARSARAPAGRGVDAVARRPLRGSRSPSATRRRARPGARPRTSHARMGAVLFGAPGARLGRARAGGGIRARQHAVAGPIGRSVRIGWNAGQSPRDSA